MAKSGMSATNVTNGTYVQNVQKAPLYFPLAGNYYSCFYYHGYYGYYWSRTAGSTSDAYYLVFDSSAEAPANVAADVIAERNGTA